MGVYQSEISLKGRDFLSIADFTKKEVEHLISVGLDLKKKQKNGQPHPVLAGKTLGMIFVKASTRTRVSFEVGMYQLGGHALFLSSQELQLRRGETVADTARTLSRYLNGIMIRTFSHEDVVELAHYASIPVINGLTDLLHPTQLLADLMTIYEYKERLAGLKLGYIGDGNNVAHSLLIGGAKVGLNVTIACPAGFEPREDIFSQAKELAVPTGAQLKVVRSPEEAAAGADVLYTDVYASMGQEAESEKRLALFKGYQINSKLLSKAAKDVIVMHCLPAHRGEEITGDVIDGSHSVVFDEAENRLHIHKAIMAELM